MTYKDQFVVEVKCKGKILRMKDDFVYLPFGSEYSLYFKNLNIKRASIKVSIDGQDILDGQALILDGNKSTELEGFLRGNRAVNRLKFIQKTKEIQEHRGDRIDDGFIRVEFAYEKPRTSQLISTIILEDNHKPFNWNYRGSFTGDSTIRYSSHTGDDIVGMARGMTSDGPRAMYSSAVNSLGVESQSQPLDDEGITVKGSEMLQQYQHTSIGELEEPEVIIIRLKGITDNSNPVQKPVSVSTKFICSSCGRKWRSSYKYCPNCGTYLE